MIPGVVASQIAVQTTATPSITDITLAVTWRYYIYNNDAATVTAYSDNDVNPPTTSRGTIAAASSSSQINSGKKVDGFTIYARAQATGKNMSDVTAAYVEA